MNSDLQHKWEAAERRIIELQNLLREAEAKLKDAELRATQAEAGALEKESLAQTTESTEAPPPPPPGPPPPPVQASTLPAISSERASLMNSIRAGKRLKKTSGPPSSEVRMKEIEKKAKTTADPNNLGAMAAALAKKRSATLGALDKKKVENAKAMMKQNGGLDQMPQLKKTPSKSTFDK